MALKKAENTGITVDPAVVAQTEETTENITPETPAVVPEPPVETPVETSPETPPVPAPENDPVPPAEPAPTPAPEPEPEPPVVVNIPETTPAASKVEVNPNSLPETPPPAPEQNVRIRMARDHRCTIAMKPYDLKKGQCYTVPPNVKRILNRAGLLLPL